ncbi:alpha/beta fold hydrolase [Polycladidibacter stylochi]|uniref:alpha/beta fold hydrolase n=1 Tax=Polycladidibacter stylochi TaxID=1807766 RepID=UPI00082A65C5|nr:alpha/beta hydrolase [Pseudovibrio stylochi]
MQLTSIDDNPVPDGGEVGATIVADGTKLRFALWPPLDGKGIKGTITIVQGRAEFIEKYFEVVEELRARGFFVVAFDFRGQGGSDRLLHDPAKGHLRKFADYEKDLLHVLDDVSLARCPGPHFLLGHSTGGAVILKTHQQLRTKVERVVLSSPLVEIKMPNLMKLLARPLAKAMVWLGLGRFYIPGGNGKLTGDYKNNRLTRDKRRFSRNNRIIEANEKLGIGSPTFGWLNSVLNALKAMQLPLFGPHLGITALVIASGNDRIVNKFAAQKLCSASDALGYLEVQGAEHELLMEQDEAREQFWRAFDAFIPPQEI